MKFLKILITSMFAFSSLSGAAMAEEMIQVKGSDTMVNLVQQLAEAYMQKYPRRSLAVTGGGSGTGIAALTNKTVDIALASRAMKESEIARAMGRGVEPKRVVIALDGLSVIVNGDNPVDKLTLPQVGSIFRGEVTNWKELGGPDMPVTLYGRQSNSGTFMLFRDMVLKGDYSMDMKRMNGNAQIVEAVKADSTSIGYVGVGYVKGATGIGVLKIAARQGADYASPLNTQDVLSGKYVIARPLFQYVDGQLEEEERAFIAFELGTGGQKIVEEAGFFPVPKEYQDFNKKSVGI